MYHENHVTPGLKRNLRKRLTNGFLPRLRLYLTYYKYASNQRIFVVSLFNNAVINWKKEFYIYGN